MFIVTAAVWYVKQKAETITTKEDWRSPGPFKRFFYRDFITPSLDCSRLLTHTCPHGKEICCPCE